MILGGRKKGILAALSRNGRFHESGNGIARMVIFVGVATAFIVFIRKYLFYYENVEQVAIEDAVDLVEQENENPDFVILDVRTPSEFERGHLDFAINVDSRSSVFSHVLNKLDKRKVYLVYSEHGRRGGKAACAMKELGFDNVFHLVGGLNDWEEAGMYIAR